LLNPALSRHAGKTVKEKAALAFHSGAPVIAADAAGVRIRELDGAGFVMGFHGV
jgi:hypothetical protein